MTRTPMVSVILPTYNRCDVVETTLHHLAAQDYPEDRLEVLVADNSTDATPDMVRRVEAAAAIAVRLVRSSERLPAVKRNRALLAATGDIVIWLNDDLWVAPDFVQQHVAAHERHTGPVAVLGYVEQSPQMPRSPFVEWYRPFAYYELANAAGQEVSYRYHWSMNLSHPRRVMIDRNLMFHEDWANIGHEDIELGYRWTRAGYPVVYEPRARGEHYHPHTVDSACRLQESIGRGLRDLEVLIPEPGLHERYGIVTRAASLRGQVRMRVRNLLFNRVTVPPVRRYLAALPRRTRFGDWAYWKVLLAHAEAGYRSAPPRNPSPRPTRLAQDAGPGASRSETR